MERMSEQYTIRSAGQADLPIIWHHRIAMFTEMGVDTEPLIRLQTPFNEWMSACIASGEYVGLLAVTESGEVVSGAGLWLHQWFPSSVAPSGRRGYILNVYTEPEHRRHGLAKRLVQGCIDHCKALDITVVLLHASQFGRPIYESMGFIDTNEMRLQL
jgi:ribosomal protein S18 acetylase RimI-like enzyme